jgi:hypothetical protein
MSRLSIPKAAGISLSKAGLVAFMDASGRGLAGFAQACAEPACTCRDLLISLRPVDYRVRSFSYSAGRLRLNTGKLGGLEPIGGADGWIFASLDPDTAQLRLDTERSTHPEAEQRLAPLRAAIDGALLDKAAALLRRLKGQSEISESPRNSVDLAGWEPGGRISFGQVFEEVRLDCYATEKSVYVATDFYCPDPSCECSEVVLCFDKLSQTGVLDKATELGRVTIDLSNGEVGFDGCADDESRLLSALWQRFVERHRGIDLLFSRNRRMKDCEIQFTRSPRRAQEVKAGGSRNARKALALVRGGAGSAKVGRNDPCPCGSQKKYKRCCLQSQG